MLPNPGLPPLILIKSGDGTHQQATAAIRAQAQIGFIQQSRRCITGKPGVDALAQPGVYFGSVGMSIIIKKNDIEIRCITQLFPTQLAVADDGESGFIPMLPSQSRPG